MLVAILISNIYLFCGIISKTLKDCNAASDNKTDIEICIPKSGNMDGVKKHL